MKIDDIYKIKGVLAVGEFDQSGKLIMFKSEQLSPVQADSTARLSGTLFSLLSNIFSIYSMYCGIPVEHMNEMIFKSQEVSLILVSGSKHDAGAFVRTSDVNIDTVVSSLKEYCSA
ncbi:MAG: DUF2173 family protein [Thermoplasmatales archaeon]